MCQGAQVVLNGGLQQYTGIMPGAEMRTCYHTDAIGQEDHLPFESALFELTIISVSLINVGDLAPSASGPASGLEVTVYESYQALVGRSLVFQEGHELGHV